MKMMVNLYLDDDLINRPTPTSFKRFTSGEELLAYLDQHPDVQIDSISLDNDLGQGKIEGYDLVKELINRQVVAKRYLIHTANIIAQQNMISYLAQAMRCKLIPQAPIKIITSRNDYHERD